MSMNSNRSNNTGTTSSSSSSSSNDDERVVAKMLSKFNNRSSSRSMDSSQMKERDSAIGTSVASSGGVGAQNQLTVTVGPNTISPTGGVGTSSGNQALTGSSISPASAKSHHYSSGGGVVAPSTSNTHPTSSHRLLRTPSNLVVRNVNVLEELKSLVKSLRSSQKSNRGGDDLVLPTTGSSTAASYITSASFKTSSGYSASSSADLDSNKTSDSGQKPTTSTGVIASASQDVFTKPSLEPNSSKFKPPSTSVSMEANSNMPRSTNMSNEESVSVGGNIDIEDVNEILLQAVKLLKKMKNVTNLNSTLSTAGDNTASSTTTNPNQITATNNKSNSSATSSNAPLSLESSAFTGGDVSSQGKREIVAANLLTQQDETMYISILVKSALIIYVDDRLTNLLGQSAKNWIGKKPIDYLYKHDASLLLTKLCELTKLINAGSSKKNIADIEIEPFYLRFRKETSAVKTSESNTTTVTCSTESMRTETSRPKFYLSENNMISSKATGIAESSSAVENRESLMPRLVHSTESGEEYVAFRVELRANKIELKTMQSVSGSSGSNRSGTEKSTSSHSNSENVIEDCIMFNLTFPAIAYYQKVSMFSERSFISQHDVNLKFTRVENKVTELLGYLPQDMESRSIIKFIHMDDLAKIKLSHIDLFDRHAFLNASSNVRQPRFDSSITNDIYRWRCYNGCYITVRTDWSCYIHPWQKQIDFIIGRHTVLDIPSNKNIFEERSRHLERYQSHRMDTAPATSATAADSLTTTSSCAYDHHQKLINKQVMDSSDNSSSTEINNTKTNFGATVAAVAAAAVAVATAATNTTSNTESGVADKTSDPSKTTTFMNNKLMFEFQSVSSDTTKKIEKEIIEYISRKIPGPDERTQQMGDEVLRFVRKSNISAHYLKEQARLLKKSRQQPVTTEPPVKIKQAIPYGGHFPRNQPTQAVSHLNSNQNQTSHHSRLHIRHYQSKPFAKMAKNTTTTASNNNHSSTSSQNFIVERIKSYKRKREVDEDHRATSGTRKEKTYKTTGAATGQSGAAASTAVMANNDADRHKHQKYLNLSQVPGDICLEAIISEDRAGEQMDVRMETDVKNNQIEAMYDNDKNKESKKEEQSHPPLQPQSSLEIAASGKRHLQSHMLKEKGLFAHYTMWKYIEELPDEWTDEATNLATMDAGGPSLCGNQPLEMEVFSPKASASTLKHTKKQAGESQDASDTSSEVDDKPEESSAQVKPLLMTLQPIVTSSNDHQLQSISHQLTQQPLQNTTTPQQSLKSRASSVTSIPAHTLIQGIVASSNQQHITLQQPPSTPPNMISFIKKATSSLSSKSHSKIVLVDENDNNDDEEPNNITNKLIGVGTDSLNLSGLGDTSINPNITILPGSHSNSNVNTGLVTISNNLPSSLTTTPLVSNILSAVQQSGASQQVGSTQISKTLMGHHSFSAGTIIPSVSMLAVGLTTPSANNSTNQPSKQQIQQQEQPVRWENPIRLTVDVLAKHTAEQDELFSLEILKSLRRPVKHISDIPTNICALNPNIYSRNEYEPNLKRHKNPNNQTQIDESSKQATTSQQHQLLVTTTVTPVSQNHITPVVSPKLPTTNFHSPATQLLRETEATGPYSHNLNDIDLDDPQNYEEIYQKKLENDYAKKEQQQQSNDAQNKHDSTVNLTSNSNSATNIVNETEIRKERSAKTNRDEAQAKRARKHMSKATEHRKTAIKNSSESSQAHMLETSVTNSSNATTTTSSSSNECKCHKKLLADGDPTGSKTSVVTTNSSDQLINSSFSGDIWQFWKRCKKFGSRIAKSLKEADLLFKDIKSASKILQSSTNTDGNEHNMDVDIDYPKRSISCSGVSNEVCSKTTESVAGGGNAAQGETTTLNDDDRNKLNQSLDSMNKRLKKKLYDIANMVGINTDIGVDDGSIDSNKTNHLDSHIKKIHVELMNTYPFYVNQYNSVLRKQNMRSNYPGGQNSDSNPTSSSVDFNVLDVNSTKLLLCIHASLKAKFLNQFQRFGQPKMSFTNTTTTTTTTSNTTMDGGCTHSSTSFHPSTTTSSGLTNNTSDSQNKQKEPADEMMKNLHITKTDAEKRYRDRKQEERRRAGIRHHHRVRNAHMTSSQKTGSKDQKTSSNSSRKKNSDIFLIPGANNIAATSSHYDDEYEDEEESYLYDSPTSSLKSLENLSTINEKSLLKTGGGEEADEGAQQKYPVKVNEEGKEEIRQVVKESFLPNATVAQTSSLLKEDLASTTTTSNSGFDDKLCSKLMSGFVDLVKSKQATEEAEKRAEKRKQLNEFFREPMEVNDTAPVDPELAVVAEPTSSNLKNQVDGENDEVEKIKSSTASNSSQNGSEDEYVKLLRLNIYDDCFKCLSKHTTTQQYQNQPSTSRSGSGSHEKSDNSSSTAANSKKESETGSN